MSKKNVIILGSGSYGEVFQTYLIKQGFNIIGFFDDNPENLGKVIHGTKVLGTSQDLLTAANKDRIQQIFCPIGDNVVRTNYLQELSDFGYETPNFIHDSVVTNDDVKMGKGVYLLPGVILMPHVTIEDFTIISMGSRIAHHTKIKRGAFISTGVNVGANITIEENAFLGISSTIMTGVQKIGQSSIIGCGAVVIKDVEARNVMAGVPAKTLRVLEKKDKNTAAGDTPNKIHVIKSKEGWNAFLADIDTYDFYHTYDYHHISKVKTESPVLLTYEEAGCAIGFPLFLRTIEGTPYKDATSVYGYPGPIAKGDINAFDNKNFVKALTTFFKEQNIISVFTRLHPYLPYQNTILKDYGVIVKNGRIVNINLNLDPTTQRQNYQGRLRTYINKARKHCTVRKVSNADELQTFVDIYHENMVRVNAKQSYFFSLKYFQELMHSDEFDTEILLAHCSESKQVIAGALFIITNGMVQYHLAGSKSEFLNLSPTKLLIDEMRLIANQKGCRVMNLGGGLYGQDTDLLFRFKSMFSKDFRDFELWSLITDPEAYDQLVNKKNVKGESNFFPLYRLNE